MDPHFGDRQSELVVSEAAEGVRYPPPQAAFEASFHHPGRESTSPNRFPY
ncbi:hypothetical protein QF027_008990 [Streptomyces canus]|nr:hypothetical protein [Streptomyces canus]